MQRTRSNLVPSDTRATRVKRVARSDAIHLLLVDDRRVGARTHRFRLAAIG